MVRAARPHSFQPQANVEIRVGCRPAQATLKFGSGRSPAQLSTPSPRPNSCGLLTCTAFQHQANLKFGADRSPAQLSPSQCRNSCGLLTCTAFQHQANLKFGAAAKPTSKFVWVADLHRFSAPSQPQIWCGPLARTAFNPKPTSKFVWVADLHPLFSTKPTSNLVRAARPHSLQPQANVEIRVGC